MRKSLKSKGKNVEECLISQFEVALQEVKEGKVVRLN
jgi:hypothetical protein